MGFGPKHYCIMASWDPYFKSKLLLLMRYLPEEKMSLRPWGRPLRGPFREPRCGRLVERQFVSDQFRIMSFRPVVPDVMHGGAMEETVFHWQSGMESSTIIKKSQGEMFWVFYTSTIVQPSLPYSRSKEIFCNQCIYIGSFKL